MGLSDFSSYFPGDVPDPEGLLPWKKRLLEIRKPFCYEMSPRQISAENLTLIEKELRLLLRFVDGLRHVSTTRQYLSSPQALITDLREIVQRLNLAIDILGMSVTLPRRQQLYKLYAEISDLLEQIAEYIKLE